MKVSYRMRTGYSMTILWYRRCDGSVEILKQKSQQILERNWRALNAFHITRLRVLSQADKLAQAIALAEQ